METMNGIDKIIARIIKNVEQEISDINREAKAKADEINAVFEEAIRKESGERRNRGMMAAEERIERLAGVALLETKKLKLSVKQEMVGRAFDLALDRLRNLPEQEYVNLLATIAAKASRSGKEEILLAEDDRLRLGNEIARQANQLVPGGGSLSIGTDCLQNLSGLILREGDIEINCTFESLIRSAKEEMATELAEMLFE
jgi:V/A-type H+/Na+-transporting ATPase subunit E